ncbi:MAG: hypothetical protein JWM68_644 [Verrucomicrobiales bacterium]|nr:hypothetical protein [Verrucomicrobiales bacterium]
MQRSPRLRLGCIPNIIGAGSLIRSVRPHRTVSRPMTRQELLVKQTAFRKVTKALLLVSMGLYVAVLLAYSHFEPQINKLAVTSNTAIFLAALVSGPIGFATELWFIARLQRRHGLLCPQCQRPIFRGVTGMSMTISATGRCRGCAYEVTTDEA